MNTDILLYYLRGICTYVDHCHLLRSQMMGFECPNVFYLFVALTVSN